MAKRASSDELRHAEKCLDLVRHFGGAVEAPKAPEARPVAPSSLETRERLLYEVVALSCVTETLSAALLGALVERARDSLAKSVLHSILRDEVGHVAIGNHWYRWLCERDGFEPVAHYKLLTERYDAPKLYPPFNDGARRSAGFTDEELAALLA